MSNLILRLQAALSSKKGISAMEYAALAAVIVVGISAAATPLKTALTTAMGTIGSAL
jgi:Flp pilus assembly pilin Flp